jgi:hypothetical protein
LANDYLVKRIKESFQNTNLNKRKIELLMYTLSSLHGIFLYRFITLIGLEKFGKSLIYIILGNSLGSLIGVMEDKSYGYTKSSIILRGFSGMIAINFFRNFFVITPCHLSMILFFIPFMLMLLNYRILAKLENNVKENQFLEPLEYAFESIFWVKL